jgi:hypothetical protein
LQHTPLHLLQQRTWSLETFSIQKIHCQGPRGAAGDAGEWRGVWPGPRTLAVCGCLRFCYRPRHMDTALKQWLLSSTCRAELKPASCAVVHATGSLVNMSFPIRGQAARGPVVWAAATGGRCVCSGLARNKGDSQQAWQPDWVPTTGFHTVLVFDGHGRWCAQGWPGPRKDCSKYGSLVGYTWASHCLPPIVVAEAHALCVVRTPALCAVAHTAELVSCLAAKAGLWSRTLWYRLLHMLQAQCFSRTQYRPTPLQCSQLSDCYVSSQSLVGPTAAVCAVAFAQPSGPAAVCKWQQVDALQPSHISSVA